MSVAATVNAEVDAILDAAMKPPPRQDGRRINHAHCVYCTVVVGESMWHGDEVLGLIEEWEGYGVMPEGPVCLECLSDYGRVRAAWEREIHKKSPARKAAIRMRRGAQMWRSGNEPTPEQQAEEIRSLYIDLGLSQETVAQRLHLSKSTIAKRMKRFGIKSRPQCLHGSRSV